MGKPQTVMAADATWEIAVAVAHRKSRKHQTERGQQQQLRYARASPALAVMVKNVIKLSCT